MDGIRACWSNTFHLLELNLVEEVNSVFKRTFRSIHVTSFVIL